MSTTIRTAAPQHNAKRLISVLAARKLVLEEPRVCDRCCMQLSRGCHVTAVREADGLLLVHDRCAGWDPPLSLEEVEAAFDQIFSTS